NTNSRSNIRLRDYNGRKVLYNDEDILDMNKQKWKSVKKDLQMVFQDPYSSLNPRKRIGDILEEPLIIHGMKNAEARLELVMDMMNKVGIRQDLFYSYPHELSGGQRQRIGLARALILKPKIIIADEPVSALDVSIQSQVINLLKNLQKELGLTYLFIAHDISVVRHISNRIGVMYLGNLVEEADTEDLIHSPLHPYTKALLSAVPSPKPMMKKERIILKGELPSPSNIP